jgi:hypothetical protein
MRPLDILNLNRCGIFPERVNLDTKMSCRPRENLNVNRGCMFFGSGMQ